MALYDQLPVFKVSYELLRMVYKNSINMERAYKFTLGERVQKETTDLLLNIYRANSTREKISFIQSARENIVAVRLLFRVAHDENQISQKQFITINENIESISKQLAAWEKSVAINNDKNTLNNDARL